MSTFQSRVQTLRTKSIRLGNQSSKLLQRRIRVGKLRVTAYSRCPTRLPTRQASTLGRQPSILRRQASIVVLRRRRSTFSRIDLSGFRRLHLQSVDETPEESEDLSGDQDEAFFRATSQLAAKHYESRTGKVAEQKEIPSNGPTIAGVLAASILAMTSAQPWDFNPAAASEANFETSVMKTMLASTSPFALGQCLSMLPNGVHAQAPDVHAHSDEFDTTAKQFLTQVKNNLHDGLSFSDSLRQASVNLNKEDVAKVVSALRTLSDDTQELATCLANPVEYEAEMEDEVGQLRGFTRRQDSNTEMSFTTRTPSARSGEAPRTHAG